LPPYFDVKDAITLSSDFAFSQNVFPSRKNRHFDRSFEKPSINGRPKFIQTDESIKSTKPRPFEMNRVVIDFETNSNRMN
jgi:hypothetical protein